MPPLPDDALVVRGGVSEPDNFAQGSAVLTDASGLLGEVSVQCAAGKTVFDLSKRIQNGKIGVTTLGRIRQAGGEIDPDPTPSSPDHCLLRGLDFVTVSRLFPPTVPNPHKVK